MYDETFINFLLVLFIIFLGGFSYFLYYLYFKSTTDKTNNLDTSNLNRTQKRLFDKNLNDFKIKCSKMSTYQLESLSKIINDILKHRK